ncbi:MAG: hypothetical protein ABI609_04695 [Acidobacteriota bacterium]
MTDSSDTPEDRDQPELADGLAPESAPESLPDPQQYFQALELQFARLRGTAVLLSPGDWKIAESWWQRGIPLDLVVRTMESLLARRAERLAAGAAGRRRINSLRYFAPAVDAAWEELRTLTAPGHIEPETPLDVPARLTALASALPPGLSGLSGWQRRITQLSGAPPEIEAGLASIDAEVLAAGLGSLTPDARKSIDDLAQSRLTALAQRMPEAEVTRAREGLRNRLVRQRLALPVLSLFAIEAMASERPADES